MRSEFVEAESRKETERKCPWASVIKKVEGGYHAWESVQDYETARNQK